MIENLEECVWHDIKKAETGFVPNHVKNNDGEITKSSERPEVFAERYDQKQRGIGPNRRRHLKNTRIQKKCPTLTQEHL